MAKITAAKVVAKRIPSARSPKTVDVPRYATPVFSPVYGNVKVTSNGQTVSHKGIRRVYVSAKTITLCDDSGQAVVRYVRAKTSFYSFS